jgi:hypothetical protein
MLGDITPSGGRWLLDGFDIGSEQERISESDLPRKIDSTDIRTFLDLQADATKMADREWPPKWTKEEFKLISWFEMLKALHISSNTTS